MCFRFSYSRDLSTVDGEFSARLSFLLSSPTANWGRRGNVKMQPLSQVPIYDNEASNKEPAQKKSIFCLLCVVEDNFSKAALNLRELSKLNNRTLVLPISPCLLLIGIWKSHKLSWKSTYSAFMLELTQSGSPLHRESERRQLFFSSSKQVAAQQHRTHCTTISKNWWQHFVLRALAAIKCMRDWVNARQLRRLCDLPRNNRRHLKWNWQMRSSFPRPDALLIHQGSPFSWQQCPRRVLSSGHDTGLCR